MTKLDEIKKRLADLEADQLTSTFELTGDMRALVDEVERLRADGLRAEKDRQAIHEMLLRAGVPVAMGAACDDPECQSQLQHRVGWLLDERDRLRAALDTIGEMAREPAERLLCARKVCETLAEFYVNGEFYGDPVTMRNLMRWMELEVTDAR